LAVVSDRAVALGDEISIVMCDARHQFWEPALSHGCPQVAPAVTHWSQQGPFGDPAGFHHRVKAFFQPLDSTI
jgi:hypothetical protein